MSLVPGTRIGPYEILAPAGAGGMGEVHRARDTRLDRTVAIKVLPDDLSSSAELRQRLEREARAISSLNHPHICHLYDVGSQGGTEYLVMEYLEGETLAQRLEKGALPPSETLKIAMEVADALDTAHRQGIVHRDLKPGNIMLTKTGAKLMDFGLAKPGAVLGPAPSNAAPVTPSTPTVSIGSLALSPAVQPITRHGTIVGTFQYMAPEVLQGAAADAVSDVFSFGCILYEMVTGRRAFEGKTQISVLAAILEKEPAPMAQLQSAVPEELDRIVRACLAKDPEQRFASARDLKLQLSWVRETRHRPTSTPRSHRRDLVWVLAVIILAVVSVLAWLRASQPSTSVLRFSVLLPGGASADPAGGFAAISPDGNQIALLAPDAKGVPALWVRSLRSAEAKELPETEHASFPFWSPDGRQIAFFADRKLKRIDINGGVPEVLADVSAGRGGSWALDGKTIIFASGLNSPIMRVAATGGDAQPVTELDQARKEVSHRFPSFLPDGRHFLYFIRGAADDVSGVYVGEIGSHEKKKILHDSSNAIFANGYLLFARGEELFAQPFDPKVLTISGEPRQLATGISYIRTYDGAELSASSKGTVAFGPEYAPMARLVWLDRRGAEVGNVGQPGYLRSMRLSPNGKLIGYVRFDPHNSDGDLWVYDLQRNSDSRLTYEPMWYTPPVWSPKSDQVAFTGNRKGSWSIFIREISSDKERQLPTAAHTATYSVPTSWSPDGRFIAYQNSDPKRGWDLWIAPVDGGKPFPFLATEFSETNGEFSPDDKWLAYVSDESGAPDVYIRPFPGPGTKIRISNAGGTRPKWRQDGKELMYVDREGTLMAVDLKSGPDHAGLPRKLFRPANLAAEVFGALDMSRDEGRILALQAIKGDFVPRVEVIVNWPEEMKK